MIAVGGPTSVEQVTVFGLTSRIGVVRGLGKLFASRS